jgi:hypothetical protein
LLVIRAKDHTPSRLVSIAVVAVTAGMATSGLDTPAWNSITGFSFLLSRAEISY